MKENTHSITQILSLRAQEFLSSPRHKSLEQTIDRFWLVNLESSGVDFLSDKILTLSYFSANEDKLLNLMLEAFSRMSQGRNVQFIEKLTFRELENFLRDENHLPVFLENEVILAEVSFKKVKNSLLAACILVKLEKFIEIFRGTIGTQKDWLGLSLLEKNTQSKLIISSINNLIPIGKTIELALAEDSLISLVMNNFPISVDAIEMVFYAIYSGTVDKTLFKVVAVQ